MNWSAMFFVNSILFGVGLAMDAFSVSIANGLNEPRMRKEKMIKVAGVFAAFQGLMPIAGWVIVTAGVQYFKVLEKAIPWMAFILLALIGGKMIVEGIKNDMDEVVEVGKMALFVQGIATSIDALSVGLTTMGYRFEQAFVNALIISIVTFIICVFGLKVGKKFGMIFASKATVFGGLILIFIGLEVFVKGVIL